MAARLKLEEEEESAEEGNDLDNSELEDGSGYESARELGLKDSPSLLVAGVVFLLSLDSLATNLLIKQAEHWLGTSTDVGAVGIDLASASAWVSGLHIRDPPGYGEDFISVSGIVLDLDFDRWSLLSTVRNYTTAKPILVKVSKIAVHGLHVTITQRVNGDSNYKEVLGHVNEVLSGPNETNTTAQEEKPQSSFKVIVDKIYITDTSATVKLHPLIQNVAGPVSYRIRSISERDVGRKEGGVPVGALINVLMDDVFDDVIQGAPEDVVNPLKKMKSLSDFAQRQFSFGKSLLSHLESLPTLPPAYIAPGRAACGSLTCRANAPCCGHGMCAPLGGHCCERTPCAQGSVCCKSLCLLPGTSCIYNSSAYGFLGHFKKAWNDL